MKTIEPKEPEKEILRGLVGQIETFFEDMQKVETALRGFAVEASFDVCTALENSPHPNVQRCASIILRAMVLSAQDLAAEASQAIRLYIDDFPKTAPDQRKEILSEFLVSEEVFRRDHDINHDDMADDERIKWHLGRIVDLVEGVMEASLLLVLEATRPDLVIIQSETKTESDPLPYPFAEHPEMLGTAFAHYRVLEMILRQAAQHLIIAPGELEDEVQDLREEFLRNRCQPVRPYNSPAIVRRPEGASVH